MNTKKFIISIIVNSIIMLVLTIFLLNQPVVHDDEKALIQFTADWKAQLLGDDETQLQDSFLFINISNDKELIRQPNELEGLGMDAASLVEDTATITATTGTETTENAGGLDVGDVLGDLFADETATADTATNSYKIEYPYGTYTISNRAVLARFLQIVNKYPEHKYIIADVLFEHDSPNDEFLKNEIERTPRIIAPSWLDDDDNLVLPKYNVNSGLATYTAVDESFVKYNLVMDSLRTLPLVMYEDLNDGKFEKGAIFGKMNGNNVFQNFVLNLRIATEDVTEKEGAYNGNYWKYLSTSLIMNSEEEIANAIKGKIIVIGDFEDRKNDFHVTATGETAGALILLNTYLALVAGDNVIHWGLYLILFVGFMGVSFFLFHPKNLFESWIEEICEKIENNKLEGKIPDNLWGKLIYETDIVTNIKDIITGYIQTFLTYMFILSLVSTAAYFLLNNHISILYISLYVFFLERIIRYVREYRERKAEKEA